MRACCRRKPVEEGSRLPHLRDVEAPMSYHHGASSGILRVCSLEGGGGRLRCVLGLRSGLVLELSGLSLTEGALNPQPLQLKFKGCVIQESLTSRRVSVLGSAAVDSSIWRAGLGCRSGV